MRELQAQNMEISLDEIQLAFGRIIGTKGAEALHGSIYQVLFLPSQLDEPASKTQYTAFCPFTGIMGRGMFLRSPIAIQRSYLNNCIINIYSHLNSIDKQGPSVIQAYKSWISEAMALMTSEARSHVTTTDTLEIEDLTSRKLSVGEIIVTPKAPMAPVYVIDFGGEREVVICPYKSEIGTADKNSNAPILSCDGKEMKVPGFLVDQRITCTKIRRFWSPSTLSNSI